MKKEFKIKIRMDNRDGSDDLASLTSDCESEYSNNKAKGMVSELYYKTVIASNEESLLHIKSMYSEKAKEISHLLVRLGAVELKEKIQTQVFKLKKDKIYKVIYSDGSYCLLRYRYHRYKLKYSSMVDFWLDENSDSEEQMVNASSWNGEIMLNNIVKIIKPSIEEKELFKIIDIKSKR